MQNSFISSNLIKTWKAGKFSLQNNCVVVFTRIKNNVSLSTVILLILLM